MSVVTYGGHESRVYFVVESTYGVVPANPSLVGINAEQVEPELDPSLIKVMGIGSRDPQALLRGLRKPHLKFHHILPSDAPTAFIQHAQTLSSLSVEVLYYKGLWTSPTNINGLVFTGCMFDKLTVECNVESYIKSTAELIAQTLSTETSRISGATYGDHVGAIPFNQSYVQRGNGDGTGLTPVTRVTDWKFNIENHLKEVPVIVSGATAILLKYLQARQRVLSGEVTFEFESKAEFDDVLNDSEFSLQFGFGTSNALFKYCKWEKVASPTKIEDLVSLKASFIARDLVIS
jgi:hypothetical protein